MSRATAKNISDAPVPDPVKPGRTVPPKTVMAASLLFAALAVWLRFPDAFGGALAEGVFRATRIFDQQIANIFTLIAGFLAVMPLFVWFVFFSGYNRRARKATFVAGMLAIVAAAAMLRYDRVDGNLVPRFAWRWSKRPDQLLEKPKGVPASGVDLTTTDASDFSGFLGADRSAYLSAPALSADWPEGGPKPLWRQPIGAGWSGFAVVNGYAVTLEQRGDEEFVTCYDARTGELKWSQTNQGRHYHPLGGTGPRSTPTIYEGRVYAVLATGKLFCLNGSTGEILWQTNLLEEVGTTPEQEAEAVMWGRAGSPLIVDDLVAVPGGGPNSEQSVSLLAYDKATGELRWRGGKRQISYASPALGTIAGERQILSVNEDTVSGHDPSSGNELWSFPFKGHSNGDASASQAIAVPGDRVFVSKGYYGGATLYRLSRDDQGAWKTELVWEDARKMKTKFTNIVIKDEFVYGLSDGILECLVLGDGNRKWKKGRYGHGQILGVGDKLVVLSERGETVLCELNPEKHVELAQFAAIEGQTWNTFALSGSLLLVRNAEEAACYELPTE